MTVNQRRMPPARANADKAPKAATEAAAGRCSPPNTLAAMPIITGATSTEYSRYSP
jgi:hypothetical protein